MRYVHTYVYIYICIYIRMPVYVYLYIHIIGSCFIIGSTSERRRLRRSLRTRSCQPGTEHLGGVQYGIEDVVYSRWLGCGIGYEEFSTSGPRVVIVST